MFDLASSQMIVYGLLAGFVFGFLLQKGGVTRYRVILGQFLLKDFTVLKVMFTAIVVGAVGIWGMRSAGMDFPMHVKNAAILANIVGGLIFGVGMAVLGYCPGTGIAAIGDGSRHAIPGVLGMIVGGALFAEVYPSIKDGFMKLGDAGKITMADVTALSPWWLIAALGVIALVLFVMLERVSPGSAGSAHGERNIGVGHSD